MIRKNRLKITKRTIVQKPEIWSILLSLIIFIGGINLPLFVYAQESEKTYLEYSFAYSGAVHDETKNGFGNLRMAILDNYDNGTIRTEFSGSINNAEFNIRNNMDESKFNYPYLPTLPPIEQTISGENGSIKLKIERLDDENIEITGSIWNLNVSNIELNANVIRNGEQASINAKIEVKILSISGLPYSFEGSLDKDGSEDAFEISFQLLDTNLDLSQKPEIRMNLLSQINSLGILGLDSVPLNSLEILGSGSVTQNLQTSDNTENNLTPYILIFGLIGAIAIISILSIFSLRRGEKNRTTEDKPLHWVN
jgi:hypothetical protein